MAPLFHSAAYYAALGLVCGLVGFRLGWRTRGRVLLPLVEGIVGWVGFLGAWRAGGPGFGAAAVAGWAAGTTLISIPILKRERDRVDDRVLRAASYRWASLRWFAAGDGPDAHPLATARAHATELLVYLAAALLTANLLALVLGAVLLGYMNAWVARLLAAATRPWTVRLLAWNVWSLARVAAYVLLGSVCAGPLLGWVGYPPPPGSASPLLIAGAVGVVLDLALKLLLARPCARALASSVNLDSVAKWGHSSLVSSTSSQGFLSSA